MLSKSSSDKTFLCLLLLITFVQVKCTPMLRPKISVQNSPSMGSKGPELSASDESESHKLLLVQTVKMYFNYV